MATQHTDSSVRVFMDGDQQIIRFENEDGAPIPHDGGEVVVKLNGAPLTHKGDYGLSKSGQTTLVALHHPPSKGSEVTIERFTDLTQRRRFNRTGGATLKEVEHGLDKIHRAVIDNMRRIEGVERLVQVEHRVVEIPAEQQNADPVLVAQLIEHMTKDNRMSDDDAAKLATAIAVVVVNEFQQMTGDLARRVAAIESTLESIASVTGGEF
jgi:hypothetical protein